MKLIRTTLTYLLTLALLLGATVPVSAAAPLDLDGVAAALADTFGISQETYEHYDAVYGQSLPLVFDNAAGASYLALGGDTAAGFGADGYSVGVYDNGYADIFAAALSCSDYVNRASTGLWASDAVDYINGADDPRQAVPAAIAQANLITFQIDSSTLLASGISNMNNAPNWAAYVDDPQTIAEIDALCGQIKETYAAKFGQNADSIVKMLEYMLFEYVSHSFEIIRATETIRQYNAEATILLLGMYNPLRGLYFSAKGQEIALGDMLDVMIHFSNIFLLDRTLGMDGVAFVDVSAASTPGFGTVELNTEDSLAMLMQVAEIQQNIASQHADQEGHNYIAAQLSTALRPPCKHPTTSTLRQSTANCKSEGYTGDTVCTVCGATVGKGVAIPKTGHSYGAWSVTKAPTCTAEGQEARTCAVCSQKEFRPVSALSHTLDKGTVTVEADLEREGTRVYACLNPGCTYTKTETIPPLGHKLDGGTVTKEADCLNDGTRIYACTHAGCTYTVVEALPALGHKLDGGTVTLAAGCESEGVKTYACLNSGCTHTIAEAISATGHAMDGGTVTVEPDCVKEGTRVYACGNSGCTYTVTETLPALGHELDDGIVTEEPDCERDGVRTYACVRVGCDYTGKEAIPAVGHHFGEYVSNGDAICLEAGTKSASCTACGAVDTLPDPDAPMDHVYEKRACVFCGIKQPTDPAAVWITVAASVAVLAAVGIGILLVKKKKYV